MSETKKRITDTAVIPPALKQQLLRRFDAVQPERLEALAALLEAAQEAEARFQQIAVHYEAALRGREAAALQRVDQAALEILRDFEESLAKA